MIVEPVGFAQEQTAYIPVRDMDCVAVSGYAMFSGNSADTGHCLDGNEDDDSKAASYMVLMTVGPRWTEIYQVSPIVTRGGFTHTDPDEADFDGYKISECTWDTIGLPPPDTNIELIRLKITLEVMGGIAHKITSLAYHLVATGKLER